MRIKLFENFLHENHQGPEVLDSFQEAEGKLSDKNGIVLSGVNGDITDIESVIDKIPHTACFILITDKSGPVPSAWKSDVFLVDAIPTAEKEMTIKEYFNANESVNESGELRIVLDAEDFANLVSGKVVVSKEIHAGPNYKIILSDIGWGKMEEILSKAKAIAIKNDPKFGKNGSQIYM